MIKFISSLLFILFILLYNSCSSFFQKSWQATNKDILKEIKVNLGKYDIPIEIKSSGKITIERNKEQQELNEIFVFEPSNTKEKMDNLYLKTFPIKEN